MRLLFHDLNPIYIKDRHVFCVCTDQMLMSLLSSKRLKNVSYELPREKRIYEKTSEPGMWRYTKFTISSDYETKEDIERVRYFNELFRNVISDIENSSAITEVAITINLRPNKPVVLKYIYEDGRHLVGVPQDIYDKKYTYPLKFVLGKRKKHHYSLSDIATIDIKFYEDIQEMARIRIRRLEEGKWNVNITGHSDSLPKIHSGQTNGTLNGLEIVRYLQGFPVEKYNDNDVVIRIMHQ